MSTTIQAPGVGKIAAAQKVNFRSGPALMKWRQERRIPRKLFARIADCSERKLATYEKAPTLPAKVKRPIVEAGRLVQALRELAGDDEALAAWLERPNPAFGKKQPLALITNGESDVLWAMIHQIRQGEFA